MGKIEPVFVEEIQEMPESLLHVLKDGDVLIVMGAGSISAVPANWHRQNK
jgi:UDP-N-acetylmuramate--alanine ligase